MTPRSKKSMNESDLGRRAAYEAFFLSLFLLPHGTLCMWHVHWAVHHQRITEVIDQFLEPGVWKRVVRSHLVRRQLSVKSEHKPVIRSSAFLDKAPLVQQRIAVQILRVLETTNEGLQPRHALLGVRHIQRCSIWADFNPRRIACKSWLIGRAGTITDNPGIRNKN